MKPTFSEVTQFRPPTETVIKQSNIPASNNTLEAEKTVLPGRNETTSELTEKPAQKPSEKTTQAITKTRSATPRVYKWRGNKQQKQAMNSWLSPSSPTFGNAYRSFKNAGFSETYSRNVISLAPKWLSEYIDKADFSDEHIKQGVQELATGIPNSKSPDDTRLKAYELLAKITGLLEGNKTQVTVVTPILGGASTRPAVAPVEHTVIDIED